jgi:hypothetical protein
MNSFAQLLLPGFRSGVWWKSGEMEPIFRDRGWRIFGEGVSGKRTVFQGESRLIKVNPGEKGVRMRVEGDLGHDVGERRDGEKHPIAARRHPRLRSRAPLQRAFSSRAWARGVKSKMVSSRQTSLRDGTSLSEDRGMNAPATFTSSLPDGDLYCFDRKRFGSKSGLLLLTGWGPS